MKNIFSLLFISLFIFFSTKDNEPHYLFDYTIINQGNVCTNDIIEFKFPFKNISDNPIIISQCKSSCGCLTPICPKEPILPNEFDTIIGILNTEGKIGPCSKTLFVSISNSDTTIRQILYLKCKIDSCGF